MKQCLLFFVCVLLIINSYSQVPARPAGEYPYLFESQESDGMNTSFLKIFCRLIVQKNTETLLIDSVFERKKGKEKYENVQFSTACKEKWHGNIDYQGTIRLDTFTSFTCSVPECVPENILGGVTDILSFFFIQSKTSFGLQNLHSTGESFRFRGFEVNWKRSPELIYANLVCDGGTIEYLNKTDTRSTFRWVPDPMNLLFLRDINTDTQVLLTGKESISLDIDIDLASGEFISGSSALDVLDLKMKIGNYKNLPVSEAKKIGFQTNSQPVRINRKISISKRS